MAEDELEKEEKNYQKEPEKTAKKTFLEKLQGNRPLVVTLLVAAIVILLLLFDWNMLRGPIGRTRGSRRA